MGVSSGVKSGRKSSLKIEKPRPLKLSHGDLNLETVLGEIELVSQSLQGTAWDHRALYPAITGLCENLKLYGAQLETLYKDQLDKCFAWLRTGCRDDRLSLAGRYRLLEIIELRAMAWKPNQNLIAYYQTKLQHIEADEASLESEQYAPPAPLAQPPVVYTAAQQQAAAAIAAAAASQQLHQHYGGYGAAMLAAAGLYSPHYATPAPPLIAVDQYQTQQVPVVPTTPLLSPGEVVRGSGKYAKPTRITGKNYCKDEVVIRNQDSGKVMGIKGRRVHMIEELSETIISFQRVAPGARERLVQITGPTDESISQAKQLIEDTIRRNASPVRDYNSSGSGSVFSASSLNGSSSSIATDDDATSLGNTKSDMTMSDYRYTVNHNSSSIRITGSSPTMVRTAKLVLDEYFNGDRNNSQILKNGSPPLLVKPATPPATPPTSSTSPSPSPGPSGEGEESPKINGGVEVIRQPLFPSSSKAAVEAVETNKDGAPGSATGRRAAFAKTTEERNKYSRAELLDLAAAPQSRVKPSNWTDISKVMPELIKKNSVVAGPGLIPLIKSEDAEKTEEKVQHEEA